MAQRYITANLGLYKLSNEVTFCFPAATLQFKRQPVSTQDFEFITKITIIKL